jgi:hypothetical protein
VLFSLERMRRPGSQIKTRADTRFFVRVQQEDGHRIWSSPIYLFA